MAGEDRPERETPMPEQGEQHVLVVDDHRDIREALRDYLRRNGYRVSVAADAAEARQRLDEARIDLVVLDIMMPGEDGLSLCRSIRAQRRIPVIFLTAVVEEADRVVGLELGADDYLVKPFSARELLARIRAVMRRWQELPPQWTAGRGERLRFDRWTLDTVRRELIGDDGPVPLSSGEYALLLALVTYAGRVLTRDQLLELTQGREARAFDRSVDIGISRLRRKIEHDPSQPRIIRTERGGGYCLAAETERE